MRLVPFAAITVGWFSLHRALGFGAARSGVYFDPLGDTLPFLSALPSRFGALWLSQLGGPWSEGYNIYPVLAPALAPFASPLAVIVIASSAYLFWPVIRADPKMRFFLLGAVIATLPACAAFPADRLLPWVAVGGAGATAVFIASFIERTLPDRGFYGLATRAAVPALLCVHLVFGPLLLPIRSTGIRDLRQTIERADAGIPSAPDVRRRVVVIVNSPADPMAGYVSITRAATGEPMPRALRWLASGPGPVHVVRVDDKTLRVRPEGGFLRLPSEMLFRSVRTHPFAPGDEIALDELHVTVTATTPDGGPAEILARFDRPLEDTSYVWLEWRGAGYTAFTPPPAGTDVTLPETDYVKVVYPPDSLAVRWHDR